MAHRRWAVLILLGCLMIGSTVFAQTATEEPEAETPNQDDIVAQGEYIVRVAAACVDCHATGGPREAATDVFNVALAGGYAYEYMPFGTVYSSNLTTLGEWSDEEIEAAIRYGIRPDGTLLLPPMPYAAYQYMSEEDMGAVIAYLRTLEPVENDIPEAQLFDGLAREDIRTAPEPLTENPLAVGEEASAAERGAYLGRAVSACVQCHAATDENGALLDPLAPLEDGILYTEFGDLEMPSLTSEILSEWSDEALINFLNGEKASGEPIFFMPVYAYQHMTEEDQQAIVAWLRTLP